MAVTTVTGRQFDKDAGGVITDRGQPAYVLLTIEEYRCLSGHHRSLAAALAQPCQNGFEFDPPRFGGIFGPADLG